MPGCVASQSARAFRRPLSEQATGRRASFAHLEHFDHHRQRAWIDRAEVFRGCVREVNDAAADERAAIVDEHLHLPPVLGVGDARHGSQRQQPMGRGHLELVVDFAVRGRPAMKAASIPGGHAAFLEAGVIVAQSLRNRHAGR